MNNQALLPNLNQNSNLPHTQQNNSNFLLFKGDNFCDYQIIKILGEGAYSTVYLAKKEFSDKKFALKIIEIGKKSTIEINEALIELRILDSFSHPYIIEILDYFIDLQSSVLVY